MKIENLVEAVIYFERMQNIKSVLKLADARVSVLLTVHAELEDEPIEENLIAAVQLHRDQIKGVMDLLNQELDHINIAVEKL